MSMKEDAMMHNKHHMWHGFAKLLVGAAILANVYWPFMSWWALVGWLIVLAGLAKMTMPGCGHHCH